MKKIFIKGILATAVGLTAITSVTAQIAGEFLADKAGRFLPTACLTKDYEATFGNRTLIHEAEGTSEIRVFGSLERDSRNSAALRENNKVDGGYLPPYNSEFDINQLNEWTTIDCNGDGQTWVAAAGAVRLEFNKTTALDDWLISPAIICEKGKLYTLTFDYKVQSKASPERFEVALGNSNTAEAMKNVVLEPIVVENQAYITQTIRFVAEEDGAVYIGFHGISDADSYALYVNNVALSAGASTAIPEAIADFNLAPEDPSNNAVKISFTAPSKTYAGDPLGSIISINIARNGEVVKSFTDPAPGSSISFIDSVPVGGQYEYTVTSANDAGISPEVSASDYIGCLTAPFASDFVNDGLVGWNIVDANEDGISWLVNKSAIRAKYNTYVDMDDWLITPPVRMEADRGYKLTFQAKCHKATHPEKLIVTYGADNTVEGMTTVLLDTLDITSTTFGDYEAVISPKSGGAYSVGFHGVSPKGMYYLYLNDIRIAEGVSTVAPGEPTDLTVVPAANAERKAEVSFKAPALTLNGNPLADLTEVKVYRNDELVKTFDSPSPGEALSFTDTPTVSGRYTYTVTGWNNAGEGLPNTDEAYIGFWPPVAPGNADIRLTPNVGEVTVSWDTVSMDDNGSYIPEEMLSYSIYNGKEHVGEGLKTTEYTYQAVQPGKQEFVQVAVYAVADGVNGHPAYSGMLPAGSPYKEYSESFANGKLHTILASTPISGGSVKLANDESLPNFNAMDGDNGYLYVLAQTSDAGADFFTGLVALDEMENPGLIFHTYNIAGQASVVDDNPITVSVRTAGSEEYVEVFSSTVDEICGGKFNSWGSACVSLAQFAGEIVQVKFTATCKTYAFTMFDKISIESIPSKDLAAQSITAPDKVKAGADYDIDVRLANKGIEAAATYTVELYADGVMVDSRECAGLASGGYTRVSFPRTMSPLSDTGVIYHAMVRTEGDRNEANNTTADITVSPIANSYPVPDELTAADNGTNVSLTWKKPAAVGHSELGVYTEDFETGEPFANVFGNWTFIDDDGVPVGGFQSLTLPGIERGESTGSFWVWDAEWSDRVAGTKAEGYRAHSGNKYIFSLFCADDGQVSDYAISPELSGESQTISFYAHSYSPVYLEKIEVLYSTGDLDLSDFEGNVAMAETSVPGSWTEFRVDIPAGARYFAIHSVATGAFMLMVDDITFIPNEPQGLDLNLMGYNVYRDGRKINGSIVDNCQFTDNDVILNDNYRYVVTAVYEQGESKGSNEVTVNVTSVNDICTENVEINTLQGAVAVCNAEGMEVMVVAADGTLCHSVRGKASMRLPVAPGIYIVKVGAKTAKVNIK